MRSVHSGKIQNMKNKTRQNPRNRLLKRETY